MVPGESIPAIFHGQFQDLYILDVQLNGNRLIPSRYFSTVPKCFTVPFYGESYISLVHTVLRIGYTNECPGSVLFRIKEFGAIAQGIELYIFRKCLCILYAYFGRKNMTFSIEEEI